MSGTQHFWNPVYSGAAIQVTATLASYEHLEAMSKIGKSAAKSKLAPASLFHHGVGIAKKVTAKIATTAEKFANKLRDKRFGRDTSNLGTSPTKCGDQEKEKANVLDINYPFMYEAIPLIQVVHNSAVAKIGPNAKLTATGDVQISGQATENNQTLARGREYTVSSQNFGDKFRPSAATSVIVNEFHNTAQAVVSSGAQIDAGGALTVNSRVFYPWVGQTNWPNGWSWKQFGDHSISNVKEFLNGKTLGLQSWFTNNWSYAISAGNPENLPAADADTVAVAGTVQFSLFDNNSEARIDAGALINQGTLPASTGTLPQSVSVSAATVLESIDYVGTNDWGFVFGNILHPIKKASKLLTATSGGLAGIGFSVLGVDVTNSTRALVGGQDTFDPRLAVKANQIQLNYNPDYTTGEALLYDTLGGTPIEGLLAGQVYYAIVDSNAPTSLQLASSAANAAAGVAISLSSSSATGVNHSLQPLSTTVTSFAGDSALSTSTDSIALPSNSNYVTGQPLVYFSGTGTAIGGLTSGQVYYALPTPNSTSSIQLATSYDNALAGIAVDLTNAGSGTQTLQALAASATAIRFGQGGYQVTADQKLFALNLGTSGGIGRG
ncbi:MAG: hypothetical protein ACKPEY_10155, partial [Planctomycetota bacterium]